MKVAIVGAGLAGCAAGYFLNKSGVTSVIYDAADEVASGASGNDVGMYNPRFTAFESPESLFYVACFEEAVKVFQEVEGIDWNPCGALHLITDEKKDKRYRQTVENWAWNEEQLRLVDAAEASEIAGVDVPFEAMYLAGSGAVSPRKLCAAMVAGLDIRFGERVESLDELDADIIVVANAMGATEFLDLPLNTVRGQITEVRGTGFSAELKANLHYGGYFSASMDGAHTIGATFQRWLDHSDILPEDDVYNIERLGEFLPALAKGLEVTGHRASVRTASKDHFPIIGRVRDNIYVSTAHGSHGILSSIGGGKMLAEMIVGEAVSLPASSVSALCPSRFKDGKKDA